MKPSRSDVDSGVSRSCGSAASTRPASRAALTSLPVAIPGWTSTPWIVMSADAALNVSSVNSPASEPSNVYAHAAPKPSMSNLCAPLPISSSGDVGGAGFGRQLRHGWGTEQGAAARHLNGPAVEAAVHERLDARPRLVG